jgi:VWFA-related protein
MLELLALSARRFILLITFHLTVVTCLTKNPQAQQIPQPRPSPTVDVSNAPQDKLKVFTEEVRVTVQVTDNQGRFDPTLERDELLVLEDGVSQEIRSIQRTPASVLVLLATNGELNPAMKTKLTKELAVHFLSRLATGNTICVMQYARDTTMLQDWTADRDAAIAAITNKAHTNNGARLANALTQSLEQFSKTPAGNRHLVLITDGVDDSSDDSTLQETIRRLLLEGIAVHVISYSQMGRESIRKAAPLILLTGKKPRKTAADIAAEILNPIGPHYEKPQIHLIIDTDIQMRRRRAEYRKAMKVGEQWLTGLASETGGSIDIPGGPKEMLTSAEEIARVIGSQYVVTYRPKRSWTLAEKDEYRSIEVAPRRVGLKVSARRGYVVPQGRQ